jgi:hypothetical protein
MTLTKVTRARLADAVADAYQFAGGHDAPAFVLDFLCWLCRKIDPVKVPHDCINPAMLRGISKAIGLPVEELFKEEKCP